jgi:outer membrane protein OmpA-like peptidoglycan-associated protein
MTTPRFLASSFLFAAVILSGPSANAAPQAQDHPLPQAGASAAPVLKLAQKTDDDKDAKAKQREEKAKALIGGQSGAADKKKEQAQKKKEQAQQAKENVLKQKQQAQQAKEKALKARQDAVKAKQDAAAAKQNAVKQKQLEAQKAKQDALKARQDALRANQLSVQQKQQAAKEKALKQKQEADAARQNAIKQRQEAQQAKDKALKAKQDVDAARAKAIKEKQDAAAARDKAIKQKLEAANKGKSGAAKFDRAKADMEFDRARKRAQEKAGKDRSEKFEAAKASKFEALRRGRKTREAGKRNIIIEPDKRVIVRNDNRVYIRHDDSSRFARKGRREVRRERRKDGTLMVVTMGLAGALIYSLQDDHGRVIRRSRRDRDGREYVMFDDRRHYHSGPRYAGFGPDYDYDDTYVDLPPPVVRIPRDRYIVEYDRASPDDLYDALNAPPIEDLDRGYSLDEVRHNYNILERMRRVDLDTVNFEFASWDVDPEEYSKLERMARAIQRVIDRSPGELFLIEGHTDAVGSEIDNLSLSDRRAETVAMILTDTFGIPPENLTTQGFGEEQLKELTEEPSWINRRVSVRRITPLLSREGWDDPS